MALAGCRVEETPDEYFDHGRSVEAEHAAATAEVRDRLLAFMGAASRGDAAEALIALNPATDIEVVAPVGLELAGGGAIRGVVSELASTPVAVRVQELDVESGVNGGVVWFRMIVEAPGRTPEPSLYNATGTYLRDAGLWELVQAHVSGPLATDTTPPSSPPDSAATPAEGE
jgi:hypothetical protein